MAFNFQNPKNLKKLYRSQNLIKFRGNFLKKYSNRKYSIRDILLKILPELKNKQILDIGCGNCSFLKKLYSVYPNNSFHALDICENSSCKILNFLDYGLYDGVNFPKYAQKFDYIFCMHMLYHVKDLKLFFKQLKMTLNQQGKILITTKSKFTFPKLESLFSKIIKEMELTNSVKNVRDEEHFCLENARKILLKNFPTTSFSVKSYILETQIITDNFKDLLRYILSTKRYNLISNLKEKAQEVYLVKWKNKLKKCDLFIDKYIEVIYVVSKKN
ncbi:MAG: class I SAM-dependent methyltransferase [Candidatus Pacebacteria bacterium]|nr:class I SAM-dependent methyltransferase [Candidatus Paceibacterota bacterium]